MRYFAVALLTALLPLIVSATGFAEDTLFLSKTSVTEGETVLIHTVVANDSDKALEAKVTFSAGDMEVGSVPAKLKAGEAATVSLSWKPEAGTHRVTAAFSAPNMETETRSATFEVKAKPSPTLSTTDEKDNIAAAVQSSDFIESKIEEFSPETAQTLNPVFEFIDTAREKAAHTLDSQLDWAKQKIDKKPPGIIAGAETGGGSWMDTVFFGIYTLYFYLLTVIRYILGNAGIFYPVAVFIFFYFLWKTFRRIRRRN